MLEPPDLCSLAIVLFLVVGEVIPEVADDAGDVALVGLDVFKLELADHLRAEYEEGVGGTSDARVGFAPGGGVRGRNREETRVDVSG